MKLKIIKKRNVEQGLIVNVKQSLQTFFSSQKLEVRVTAEISKKEVLIEPINNNDLLRIKEILIKFVQSIENKGLNLKTSEIELDLTEIPQELETA